MKILLVILMLFLIVFTSCADGADVSGYEALANKIANLEARITELQRQLNQDKAEITRLQQRLSQVRDSVDFIGAKQDQPSLSDITGRAEEKANEWMERSEYDCWWC